jgi:hypothetical protein
VTGRRPHLVDEGDARLRAAFRVRPRTAAPGDHVPAEDLWSAVRGELSADERRAIVDHTASCAECAEAWRLAVEVTPDPIPVAAPAARPAWTPFRWPATFAPLAAAAALVAAVGAGVWLSRAPAPANTPAFRGGDAPVVRSLVGDDDALPREQFVLRWSAGPEGSRYDVRVTTEGLQVVAEAEGLTEPALVVPPTALSSLPAGSRLLWRVEVVAPDGERAASPTFVTRLRP